MGSVSPLSPVCPHMGDTSSAPLALPGPADLRASEFVPSPLTVVRWCGADFEFSRLIQRSEVLLNEGGGVLSSIREPASSHLRLCQRTICFVLNGKNKETSLCKQLELEIKSLFYPPVTVCLSAQLFSSH